MNIARWEPFRALDEAFGRMPALFDRWPRSLEENGESRLEWAPSVNISETDTEYLIRAELPAVAKEDVHVTFDDGMLTVSGERKQRKEEKTEKFHRVESVYGKFSRTFTLPDNVDSAAIKAESKDGVLSIHVPKSKVEKKQATQIKVQ